MRRKILMIGTLVVLLVNACTPQAAPTISSQNVQNSSAAVSTVTPALPTETATPVQLPTETALPTQMADTAVPMITDTLLPTITGTSIPQQPSETPGDPCSKPLTSWKGPTARLSIFNETKPQGRIVLSLYVVTPLGECGSLADLSSGPVGSYSARAYVNGKKNFTVFGDFQISEGSWKIVVRNDKIIALGSCYPSC